MTHHKRYGRYFFFFRWNQEIYEDWAQNVGASCSHNMSQPLLLRNQNTDLISVNFDAKLTAILREVKYLKVADVEEIPESARDLFKQNDMFWKYVTNLDLIVHLYNKVRNKVLGVEYPLIEGQLKQLDVILQQAETTLTWESEGLC